MSLIISFRSHAAAAAAKKVNPGGPDEQSILGKRKREDRDGDPDDHD
jgi:hypothetical protein